LKVGTAGGCNYRIDSKEKVRGRRLEYFVKTEIHVMIYIPPIEKIELIGKTFPNMNMLSNLL